MWAASSVALVELRASYWVFSSTWWFTCMVRNAIIVALSEGADARSRRQAAMLAEQTNFPVTATVTTVCLPA